MVDKVLLSKGIFDEKCNGQHQKDKNRKKMLEAYKISLELLKQSMTVTQ